jgi:tRNA(Ile)-lysidine synthase
VPVDAWGGLLHAAATARNEDETIGVAVSGGSDSLAALHLLRAVGARLLVATVDHGLRAEAAAEAMAVGQHCVGLGVPHETLVWKVGPKGAGNLMEQARDARYSLLADWARRNGVTKVVLGHTADDQSESFLMALARGTGLDGLTGMRRAFVLDGVPFLRPFLDVTRSDLRDYLIAQGVQWIDDPSNDNPRFARTHARRAMRALQPLGITTAKLQTTMANLRAAQAVIRRATAAAAVQCVQEKAGALYLDGQAFAALPEDVRHRLIVALLRWIAGNAHPARAEGIARVTEALRNGGSATLAGCRVRRCWMMREPKAAGAISNTTALWDDRWRVSGPHAPDLTIRALGEGIRQCPDWRATGLSRDMLMVTPAIWQGETLVAAPLAGLPNGWTAEIAQSFHAFILSH